MKSNRNRRFLNTPVTTDDEKKSVLNISSILINVIAVAALIGIYYYVVTYNVYEEKQTYIYWIINVLISYNILVASTRSVWAPLLSVLGGVFGIYELGSPHAISFLTSAECWQLAILGVIGLLITFSLRL